MRILTAAVLSTMLVLPVQVLSARTYYVRSVSQGNDDGSSWADAWDLGSLDWSAVHSALDSEDVYVYFKRGDVFEQDSSRVVRILYHNGSWLSHNGPRRLVLTVDPSDSGDKPRFQVPSGRTAYSLLLHGDYETWQDQELGYVTFDNLEIRWPYTTPAYAVQKNVTGISIHNVGDAVHVTNCDIHGTGHYAVALYHQGQRCIVTDNHFEDAGNGIYFCEESGNGGSHHYVARNTCVDINADLRFDVDGSIRDGHCVALQSNDWCIVEDNSCLGCRTDFCLWVKGPTGCPACAGQYNVFRRNFAKDSSFLSFTVGGSSQDPNPDMNRNLFYQNIASGPVEAFRQSHADANPGNKWFNNTIYHARPDTGTRSEGAIRIRRLADHHAFTNNIVDVADADDCMVSMTYGSEQYVGVHNYFNHNLYTRDHADGWRYRDGSSGDFAFWQGKSATYNDPDSRTPADPMLTDPDNDDFALQPGSPAIDAGGWLTHVTGPAGSGTTFQVDDPAWLHDAHGLSAHGATGTEISLYDDANGRQDVTITLVDYATRMVTVDADVTWEGGNSTTIALRFHGSRPDIGAVEHCTDCTDLAPAPPTGLQVF